MGIMGYVGINNESNVEFGLGFTNLITFTSMSHNTNCNNTHTLPYYNAKTVRYIIIIATALHA